ncbi:glucose-6-phosphate isomerase family protein [Mucilaginibacter agri]|uniref:glucose-6-phosphate isomerase n=1 Tax=Mucilaginibacter agri TaxID=2695265 RepID=A0A965ZM70_9SPHI|nr:glucose-6-phosphate isomerase family protein [Mucilaginibacter agri]NCD72523.1 glucose-6-phosphate isomerase [Mucilaginibacter agri]
MNNITKPNLIFKDDLLTGENIDRLTRKLKDLGDIFNDKAAFAQMDGETVVYDVESSFPVAHGTEGGLFYGITYIHPGKVGQEYFMTKGHFHEIRNRGEYYCTLEGEGMLLLMDENGNTRAEKMIPGSIHYIPGNTAHRTANVGEQILSFSAFWPSDAGHDYGTISEKGFSEILIEQEGQPVLVPNIKQ